LCFGFSHSTRRTPERRTTRHFSQIVRTDVLTFITTSQRKCSNKSNNTSDSRRHRIDIAKSVNEVDRKPPGEQVKYGGSL
jgi:hypothetical protein